LPTIITLNQQRSTKFNINFHKSIPITLEITNLRGIEEFNTLIPSYRTRLKGQFGRFEWWTLGRGAAEWSPPSLSLSSCTELGQGGGRVRVSGVSRGRWRREKDRGFVGFCPSRRGAVAALSLFPCTGLGRAGARVRVSGGEQREMEKGAGVGVLGCGKLRK